MLDSSQRQYIPYAQAHKISDDQLLIVDSHYHRGLVLAHFYEDRVPETLRSTTSTEAVFKWLHLNAEAKAELGVKPKYVTCNHWDIDGFLAVWTALYSPIAKRHQEELEAAALLGDFREFDFTTTAGMKALKICALLNHIERTTFCLPFGELADSSIEHEVAERKFEFFLSHFALWLEQLEDYRGLWQGEFTEVIEDIEFIDSGKARIQENAALDLSIIHTPRPLHYYAAFSRAKSGAVLTFVSGTGYVEFEYKYETRVGKPGKTIRPRVDLTGLAEQLTALERTENVHWVFDNINEGGPILRPEFKDNPLSHEARYQNMRFRMEPCPKTSIGEDPLRSLLAQWIERGSLVAA
jgi:hypothetical protein